MKKFIFQYRLLFFISWVILYLIFPAWALPVSVSARAAVFFGLLIYFLTSSKLAHRWLSSLAIDKPLIMTKAHQPEKVGNKPVLLGICFTAAVLHLYPISLPILIMGDETIHLVNGLMLYKYIDVSFHIYFQIAFWIIVFALIAVFAKIRKNISEPDKGTNTPVVALKTASSIRFFIAACGVLITVYFLLLKNIPYYPDMVRYPPLSKIIYFIAYAAFGISHINPRIVQLIFYLLCAVYLYRTIKMFHDEETALLGASIYLFLPVAFVYGHLGELASGTIFFIVVTSFYFLRFIRNSDDRDLVIAAYLIGIACLYKKLHVILFIVCFGFLVLQRIKKRDFQSLLHFKILLLALVPIIPWMIITRYFSWRNYTFILSNLTSMDGKIVTYLSLISSNISGIFFLLFCISVFYFLLYRRNTLTDYFGLVFAVYYFFIVSDMGGLSPRFSMAFYPTITVYLSVFIYRLIQYVKWRHAFKACFIIIAICLITVNTVSPLNRRFLTITEKKLYYFPADEAAKWIRNNVEDGEKILNIRVLSTGFYKYKYSLDDNKILDVIYSSEDVSTPERLINFYRQHDISYIMFPYNEVYTRDNVRFGIIDYLKENTDGRFRMIKAFERSGNFIYICTLQE